VTPSRRASFGQYSVARITWLWLSMSPGITVRPARSTMRVAGPALARSASLSPTAPIRSPAIAIACSIANWSSTVTILPLTSSRSGVCAIAGAAQTRRIN